MVPRDMSAITIRPDKHSAMSDLILPTCTQYLRDSIEPRFGSPTTPSPVVGLNRRFPSPATSTLFTQRENDGNSLYYMRGRYYAPAIGRFISRDPAGFAGGFNLYEYAGDSPTNFTDPTGLCGGEGGCGNNPNAGQGPAIPHGFVGVPSISQLAPVPNINGFDIQQGRQTNGGLGEPLAQADEDEDENPLSPPRAAGREIEEYRERFIAQEIAGGHAFEKHIDEFPGISTRAQFAAEIDRILRAPTATRALRGGREAFWDTFTGTVVIYNPNDPDLGTAFKPTNGRQYFDRIP